MRVWCIADGRGLYRYVLAIPPDDFEWYVSASVDQGSELVFPAGWADENETVTVVVM